MIIYRRDLRTADNPAANEAPPWARHIYVVDPTIGGAQKWWLHYSLKALTWELARNGAKLEILEQAPSGQRAYQNRTFDQPLGFDNGYLYTSTCTGSTQAFNTTQYKARAPKNTRAILPPRIWGEPIEPDYSAIERYFPLPKHWTINHPWKPGERGAMEKLIEWDKNVSRQDYAQFRGYPSHATTSMLSPHIHFGEISPLQIQDYLGELHPLVDELPWREFKHDWIHRYTDLEFRGYCRDYPWSNNTEHFEAWCKGETGFRVVDAGMRELWQTGFMNNRVRMVVSSFLTKLLDIDWRWGARWFADTLCDHDHAINWQSWQDSMAAAHDSRPYPIIMNPITQYEKFSMREYCDLWAPDKKVFPIIDYKHAREAAIARWDRHKNSFDNKSLRA